MFISASFLFLQELHTETIDKDAGAIEHLAWSADGSILSACTKHGYFYSFAVLASDSGMWGQMSQIIGANKKSIISITHF